MKFTFAPKQSQTLFWELLTKMGLYPGEKKVLK